MQRFLCVWENIGIRRHIFFGNLHVGYCTYSVGEPPANNNLSPIFKSKFSFIKSLLVGPSLFLFNEDVIFQALSRPDLAAPL